MQVSLKMFSVDAGGDGKTAAPEAGGAVDFKVGSEFSDLMSAEPDAEIEVSQFMDEVAEFVDPPKVERPAFQAPIGFANHDKVEAGVLRGPDMNASSKELRARNVIAAPVMDSGSPAQNPETRRANASSGVESFPESVVVMDARKFVAVPVEQNSDTKPRNGGSPERTPEPSQGNFPVGQRSLGEGVAPVAGDKSLPNARMASSGRVRVEQDEIDRAETRGPVKDVPRFDRRQVEYVPDKPMPRNATPDGPAISSVGELAENSAPRIAKVGATENLAKIEGRPQQFARPPLEQSAMKQGGSPERQFKPDLLRADRGAVASAESRQEPERTAFAAPRISERVSQPLIREDRGRSTGGSRDRISELPPSAVQVDAAKPLPAAGSAKVEIISVGFNATQPESYRGAEDGEPGADVIDVGGSNEAKDPKPLSPGGQTRSIDIPARPILAQIVHAAKLNGEGTVEVRLFPEELGRVRLSMSAGEVGMVVHIVAERADTLDLLRRNIDMLAADLQQNGFEDLDFTFGQDGGASSAGHEFDLEDFANLGTGAGSEASATTARTLGILSLGGGLDIRL